MSAKLVINPDELNELIARRQQLLTATLTPLPYTLHRVAATGYALKIRLCLPAQFENSAVCTSELSGADAENLGATRRTNALCGRLPILHRYFLRIFNLALAPALHTIGFH